ncbi:MAG: hypothetical protein M9962_12515 [Oligoflexia bacterium]|nr:hypothetical protein [Oligoflexia bacterium]
MKSSEISQILGRRRSCINASTRTLRKTGISELNLSSEERKLIEFQISEEKKKLKGASR